MEIFVFLWCYWFFLSLFVLVLCITAKDNGEKNRTLEMSVGVGRCQNEICGNFCLQSQWLASVTAHPLTTASLKPGASFPNQIPVLFVLCAAATRWMMGQNWRKPFHTSREGGCKDKGDDVVRMASITINHNTALGAQRTCHRFCLFELLLLPIYKETFTAVTTRRLQRSFFDKWLMVNTRFWNGTEKLPTLQILLHCYLTSHHPFGKW